MGQQQQSDPWAEAAKNFKPQPGGQPAPASGPNEDWKMWQQQDDPDQPPSMMDKMKTNFNANTQGAQSGDGKIVGALKNFGAGGGDVMRAIAHPVDTLTGMAKSNFGEPEDTGVLGMAEEMGGPAARGLISTGKSLIKQPMRTLGQIGTGALLGDAVGSAIRPLAGMAREAALGDPDAAALRGLQVGAKSPKTLRTLNAVEGARPYFQGSENLADAQSKLPGAKSEIWSPYNDAIDAVGDKPVKGPDGMTTVRALEDERQQLSALNRGLKSNLPEAVQLAQQKGMTAAQLLERENVVKSALDPELAKTGIDPNLIRKTFGQVSEVGGRMSGKSTLIEKPQPSGLGKMMNLSLEHPFQAPSQIAGGLRDMIAGRPWLEAKPTDMGIKEGFRAGGPKPDFGRVTTTTQPPPARGLLGSGPTQMAAPPEVGGTPAGYQPPPIASDTTPMRLGRLLPASTKDTRLPMSSYHEQFPEQLPNSRLLDFINRSK